MGSRSGGENRPAGSVSDSRALSPSFPSHRRDLLVAVNHLDHQPHLQPDDGNVHHHLGQDGGQAPGDWRETETQSDARSGEVSMQRARADMHSDNYRSQVATSRWIRILLTCK